MLLFARRGRARHAPPHLPRVWLDAGTSIGCSTAIALPDLRHEARGAHGARRNSPGPAKHAKRRPH
jgi:hypothetical protein